MNESVWAGFPALIAFVLAGVLLAIALPVLASFVLDALVWLLRGRRLKPIVFTSFWTLAAAGVGVALWQYGIQSVAGDEQLTRFAHGAVRVGGYVFPVAVIAAIVGFAVRFRELWRRTGSR